MKGTRKMSEPREVFMDSLPMRGVPLSAAEVQLLHRASQKHLTDPTLKQSETWRPACLF